MYQDLKAPSGMMFIPDIMKTCLLVCKILMSISESRQMERHIYVASRAQKDLLWIHEENHILSLSLKKIIKQETDVFYD
jgi:hypothetical protein